jgi:cyanate permease
MLALVWAVYACFGLTLGTLPALVEPIRADLNMTSGQMGFVLGAWQLVYIVTASPLGALVDRMGARRSIMIGIMVVLLSLVLRGLAVDFWTLILAVAFFGVGGPVISIGAPKVVAQWFQGRERGPAAAVYATGPLVGISLALATAARFVVPVTGSWRGMSLIYGIVVLAVAVVWWLLAREAPSAEAGEGRAQAGETRGMGVLMELLRIRNVQVLLLLAIATFLLNHALTSWMPTLLEESGMSLAQAGSWVSAGTIVGILGLLLSAGFVRHGYRVPAMGVLLTVGVVTTVGLALLSGPSLVGAVMVSGIVRTPMMPLLTLILMETPGIGARRIGASAGLFFAAAEIGGFGGPWVLGVLRDVTGDLTVGMLVLAAAVGVLMVVLPLVKER